MLYLRGIRMTENKRFVYYEHKGADYILDTPNESLDFIEMLGDCLEAEEIVDLLNEQHEQINTLRESRRELISVNNEYRMRETELAQELSALVDENEQLEKRLQIYKSDGLETVERLQRCYNNSKKAMKTIDALDEENEQLKQQLNKVFVLLDIKQKISKENMEEWAFKDVPASTTREYYYSGMLDACMQLRDEILNGDVE